MRYIDGQIKERRKRVDYAYYPIVVDETVFGNTRDDIFIALEEQGVHARKYFYPLTSVYDCYNGRYDVDKTPNALWISKRVLTLPLYSDLPYECIDKISEILHSLKNKVQ